MERTQYTDIAEEYAKAQSKRLIRTRISDPSLFRVLRDITGLDVLDVGCGSGYLTRQLKLHGARRLLGVDAEREMIRLALKEEKARPLGIEYRIYRAENMPVLGQFDLIVPSFLLHYAKTKEELEAMCRNIFVNLKQNGRLVGINQNPDNPINPHREYGSSVEPEDLQLREGSRIIIIKLWDGDKEKCCFYNYHWNKQTYEHALRQAGFEEVSWHPAIVSEEGVKEKGLEFWEGWNQSPSIAILEARR